MKSILFLFHPGNPCPVFLTMPEHRLYFIYPKRIHCFLGGREKGGGYS
jgi:hypothetical protein